jgi:hypothetical protein
MRRRDFDEIIFYLFCQNFSYNENFGYRIAQDFSRIFLLKNLGTILGTETGAVPIMNKLSVLPRGPILLLKFLALFV